MKKVLLFVLAALMMAGTVFSVFADNTQHVDSPTPPDYQLVSRSEGCTCHIVLWGQRNTLPAAKKAAFQAAKECLKDAVPEGYTCRDFVYQDASDGCGACNIDLLMNGTANTEQKDTDNAWVRMEDTKVCATYKVELSLDGVSDVAVKQYKDNTWVEREVHINESTVSILGIEDGPMAIFMK